MSLYFLQSYEEILTNEKKNRKKIKKTHESESFLEVRGGVVIGRTHVVLRFYKALPLKEPPACFLNLWNHVRV